MSVVLKLINLTFKLRLFLHCSLSLHCHCGSGSKKGKETLWQNQYQKKYRYFFYINYRGKGGLVMFSQSLIQGGCQADTLVEFPHGGQLWL